MLSYLYKYKMLVHTLEQMMMVQMSEQMMKAQMLVQLVLQLVSMSKLEYQLDD